MKIEARSVSLGEESQRSLAPILSFPSSRTATCAKIGEQVLLTDASKASIQMMMTAGCVRVHFKYLSMAIIVRADLKPSVAVTVAVGPNAPLMTV